MKQCRVCGTRNREKYQNCVRCGEPLPSAPTRAAAGSSGFPPAVKLALTIVVLLGIMIAGFRFMARGTSSSAEIPPAHFDSSSATAEDADLFSIDEALDAEEVDQTLNEASVTTRNGKEASTGIGISAGRGPVTVSCCFASSARSLQAVRNRLRPMRLNEAHTRHPELVMWLRSCYPFG